MELHEQLALSKRARAMMNILEDAQASQRELQKNKERIETILDQTNVAMYEYEPQNGLMRFAGPIAKMTGTNASAFDDMRFNVWMQMIHREDVSALKQALDDAHKNRQYTVEYRIERSDGKFLFVEEHGIYTQEPAEKVPRIRSVLIDVTSKKQRESKIRELDELRNRFIRIVSHQLRTPLNSIRWNIETLLDGDLGALNEAQRDFLDVTRKSSLSITTRVHDLLTALDIEEGRIHLKREDASFAEIIRQSLAAFKDTISEKRINVKVDELDALPNVSVDNAKMSDVMMKILENAVAYTPEDGHIIISSNVKNRLLHVSIQDDGIGISEEDKKKLFTRFHRGENAVSMKTDSSGLGLFIAKYYVEAHDGAIRVTSKEGEGTKISFMIPITTSYAQHP